MPALSFARSACDCCSMREKELRLALICYGGVSLAVYMHGITREVWHLARASRALHDAAERDSDLRPIERVYRELLAAIDDGGLKLRVLTDIVAGASAGGINGIFLGQAIATGQSLEPLTDLWLDGADVDALLAPQSREPSRFSKLWAAPLVWAFSGRQGANWDDGLDPATRDEISAKLTRFVRARWFTPPFGGEIFDRLLLAAFDAMAAGPQGPRLLPDAQPLDLFVTVTDFHGHPEMLRLNSPPEIVETEHRLTFAFRDAPGDPATLGAVPDLVFAARATASFPGAFPPFNIAELDRVLGEDARDWPGRDGFLRRMLPHRAPEKAVLIDGSVLANAPFRPAIEALRDRPARREVDRRFVYIDPKPGVRSVKLNRSGDAELPGFFATVFGALSDIPREQPIRDNLDAIEQRTARVVRAQTVTEALRPEIEAAVARLFGRTFFLDRPNARRLTGWRMSAEARAASESGYAWSAYLRLRTENCGGGIADGAAFLDANDRAFRLRRLRFMSRQLATLTEASQTADYEPVRVAVFARMGVLFEAPETLDLAQFDLETDATIAEALASCATPDRRAPLFAWLGFAFYDVATYALLQGEGFDEFDAIKVDRISPEDAQSLRAGGVAATLKGVQFNSFGAFFSRTYRENDYLWGRLHGAERLIDIIASTVPSAMALAPEGILATKHAAFAAILDEEAPRLRHAVALIASLRAELEAMTGKAADTRLD